MDTTLTLTTDMELVLGLVVFTMAMFLFERIRADVVALVVMVVLSVALLVVLFKFLRAVLRRVSSFFGGSVQPVLEKSDV